MNIQAVTAHILHVCVGITHTHLQAPAILDDFDLWIASLWIQWKDNTYVHSNNVNTWMAILVSTNWLNQVPQQYLPLGSCCFICELQLLHTGMAIMYSGIYRTVRPWIHSLCTPLRLSTRPCEGPLTALYLIFHHQKPLPDLHSNLQQ